MQTPPLSAEAESAIYRAMQEALSNAVRHAGADHVEVRLERGGEDAVLTVTDDGAGLPDDAASRLRSRGGLAGIRERVTGLGGHFDIGTAPGRGAQLRVAIPVDGAGSVSSQAGVP